MKQIYSSLCGRSFILAFLSLSSLNVFAQKNTTPVIPPRVNDQIKFIVHAPVVMPALLEQRKYDSLQNFLFNWGYSAAPDRMLIFSGKVLLAMQTGVFPSMEFPCDGLLYLSEYAKALHDVQTKGAEFKYLMELGYRYSYDATEDVRPTLLFLQSWARGLLAQGGLDLSELFIARVLAGEITNPEASFHADRAVCPRIAQVEDQLRRYNQKTFATRRDSTRGTAAVMVGWWFPTGHLQVLGSHPSVGVQLGKRNKLNEYDVTWCFRFLHPTPQEYSFVRQDTLYTSRYYDGGYIGFEYTRYLVHKKYLDFGVISGIAYDYFSVSDGFSNEDHGLLPLNVGSFDFNSGLRLKYFLRRRAYVGLTAKYHLINYANDGGTDLSGNAFTVDLSFGSH